MPGCKETAEHLTKYLQHRVWSPPVVLTAKHTTLVLCYHTHAPNLVIVTMYTEWMWMVCQWCALNQVFWGITKLIEMDMFWAIACSNFTSPTTHSSLSIQYQKETKIMTCDGNQNLPLLVPCFSSSDGTVEDVIELWPVKSGDSATNYTQWITVWHMWLWGETRILYSQFARINLNM